VKRIIIEVARDTAILNADDPLCLKMAGHTEAAHIGYVTMSQKHALVKEHLRAGGRACVLEEGINGHMITLYDKGAHMPLLWTHLVPATLEGRAMHNVQNAMFAALTAYAMGVKLENIRHGLRTFDTSFFQAPGRMNIFDEHGFKVILDYAHNPAAVEAMCLMVRRLEAKGKKICVLAAPGDRRDEDIREIARHAAGVFDAYICRRDDGLRGRGPEEVPLLLRDGLVAHGVPKDAITVIPSEVEALDAALRRAEAGDLLLALGDNVTRAWKQIIYFRPETKPPGPIAPAEPAAMEDAPEPVFDEEAPLMRDERGVWLPAETDD